MRKRILVSLTLIAALALSACELGGSSVSFDSELSLLGEKPEKEETGASVSESTSVEETPASDPTLIVETPVQDEEEYYYGDYKELSEGDRAPWFKAELSGGGSFDVKDNLGKVIVVNIWATWCGPCVREMPAFEKLYQEYGADGDVVIVAVNACESKSTVDTFVNKNGYTFPIAYDEEGNINNQYPTDGIPYTVIIGKDGLIKTIHLGAMDAEAQYKVYKADIEAALSE